MRPDRGAGGGEPGRVRVARDAEVDEVDEVLAAVVDADQHVGRLDVAVHEALGVRRVQRAGHLAHDPDSARRRQRALPREHLGEVGAVDQPHVDVELAVDLAVVVDRDDVRLGQPRGDLGLAAEPRLELRVGREVARAAA